MNQLRNVICSGAKHFQKPASTRQIFAAPPHRLYSRASAADSDPSVRTATFDVVAASMSADSLILTIAGKFSVYVIDPTRKRAEDPLSTLNRVGKEKIRSVTRELRLYEVVRDSIGTKTYQEIHATMYDMLAERLLDERVIEDLNENIDDRSLRFHKFIFQGFAWNEQVRQDCYKRSAEMTWRKQTEDVLADVKSRAEAIAMLVAEPKELQGVLGRVVEEAAEIRAAAKSQLDQIEEILKMKVPHCDGSRDGRREENS